MENTDERVLELAYKNVSEFEQASYEKVYQDESNQIVYQVDKELFLQLENVNEDQIDNQSFESETFSSYRDLFNKRFRPAFKRNVKHINPILLHKEIGEEHIELVTNNDDELKNLYRESIKELDLDNDGVPDRIDIDDSRNSVQTVADLDLVGNSTDKENAKQKKRSEELEL